MWAIPTGTSLVLKKKKKKSPSPESRVQETGSDPPFGSDRDSGRDNQSNINRIGQSFNFFKPQARQNTKQIGCSF